jgi:hypothetical protein
MPEDLKMYRVKKRFQKHVPVLEWRPFYAYYILNATKRTLIMDHINQTIVHF